METRLKVAAAAASVVPFHCVICFEEFNLKDRTPMVLPCGHTYVCSPCCKRLKRCMECREPLFLPGLYTAVKPLPNGSVSARPIAPAYNRGRYSPQPVMNIPQACIPTSPPAPIPLPIPKNVVLIALMEAAERQLKTESETVQKGQADEEEDDEEEYNLDRIISGMSTLSGPCGTYVVKETKGLAVVSCDPRKHTSTDEEKKENNDDAKELKEPFLLSRGQRVQVVSFADGVAKLARGAGYIYATSSQLVKVGQPMEAVCRLEGLLDTIKRRGKDLQSTLEENQLIEASICKQIEAGKLVDPIYPVIMSPPKSEDFILVASSEQCDGENHAHAQPRTPPSGQTAPTASSIRTPHTTPPSTDTELGLIDNRLEFFGITNMYPSSPNSIDNSDIAVPSLPTYRRARDDDEFNQYALGCGAAFIGHGTTAALFGESVRNEFISGTRDYYSERPIQPSLSRGANSPEHFVLPEGPILTSSFDTVDFRTGLSGHRALSNAKASPKPRGHVRLMMSEHRGIGRVRGPLRRQIPASAPTFGPRFSPLPQAGGLYEHHV